MVGVPRPGLKLKQPNPDAYTRPLLWQPEAATPASSAGRASGYPVLYGSRPVVMLYGTPLLATRKGLTLNFHRTGMVAPAAILCRMSPYVDGPHSARRSYGFAGMPSLLSLP